METIIVAVIIMEYNTGLEKGGAGGRVEKWRGVLNICLEAEMQQPLECITIYVFEIQLI